VSQELAAQTLAFRAHRYIAKFRVHWAGMWIERKLYLKFIIDLITVFIGQVLLYC
jgi:hypothetical protein